MRVSCRSDPLGFTLGASPEGPQHRNKRKSPGGTCRPSSFVETNLQNPPWRQEHFRGSRFRHMLSNLQVAVGKSDTLMIPHWGNNVRKTDSTERTWSRKLSGHYFQLRNQAVHFKMQRAMTHPGFTTQFGVFSGPSSKSTRAKAIHVQL